MRLPIPFILLFALLAPATTGWAQTDIDALHRAIDEKAAEIEGDVIGWRRDIHEHPELSNRETRTAALVAAHLRTLGFDEVRTGVAHTGVVGVLRGGRPGPVVALRADMDALPVTERVDLPFASKVTTEYAGREVGVMHACGHDVHTAVLMGAAATLASMREDLPGTVVFLFQPAEEGAPAGERGGALVMIEEGALENPAPSAIFGLHTWPVASGTITYRPGGAMASADKLRIVVEGRQTHGAKPWNGVDPIVTASQIVVGLQTIVSREVDPTTSPAVVTIGKIEGGVRFNIIPDRVEMTGTVRNLDPTARDFVLRRIEEITMGIAGAANAAATVEFENAAPVTYNDPELTERMVPTLQRVTGGKAFVTPPITPAEDFAFFQEKIPGLYVFLGTADPGDPDPAPNHSPLYRIDESAIELGVRTMASLAVDYLAGGLDR